VSCFEIIKMFSFSTRLRMGFGLYASTSYFFLKNPELLHPKNDRLAGTGLDSNKVIFAHRGGSCEAPENTMQAFRKSFALKKKW
jgi:glycerophosphoryl diester phosphodiesterase